ncbi:MAG TPA: iron-sulfur cluster assembly accessory protein [Thermoanaerobaculales bacterium]|nr:iron-sulfur cluster assembly accessory protein [Thermoanaerobaculales bacterium]HPA80172.1 iron-sulfur cluster assembly accessory protein [Thermoanaerobaculales bacterium]HQL28675.1 iron-sulfur cluster assembly accessory protein [Thermoanaerobaculales bacterium]HQN96742.1 iron-sulfur cluster assembly accessory protein [Thermoanaerobaculales bacterium]HQP43206.1 iron-sulfur cluster assembly accessory protein [Thermoanaerobaculales bacterium]
MISFSERAIEKVKDYARQMPESTGKELRMYIEGVGCGGFSYGFTFDEEREGDTVVESGDLKVLVDPHSAPHLAGATVDFVEDGRGAGFTVDNPNRPDLPESGGCSGCSCG